MIQIKKEKKNKGCLEASSFLHATYGGVPAKGVRLNLHLFESTRPYK